MENNDLKGQEILLVHAMSPGKKFILQRMKKLGLNITCISREKSEWAIPYVDHWIFADLNNYKDSIEAVKSFNLRHPQVKFAGVVTFWDECVLLTSRLVDVFGFVGTPFTITKKIKNKYSFREHCEKFGIPAPKHCLLKSLADIPAIEKELNYPLVIKPIYGACSAFVMRINNREEFKESYEYIKNNIHSFWLAPEWDTLELFVEEYIDGNEVDIDILIQNGKIKFYSISDNFNKTKDRFFVDSGQAIPSSLPEKTQDAVIDMVEETLEKFGVQDACVHFEAKASSRGVYPIEVNMRMGGDYVYSYLLSSWGVDLVEYSVRIAFGKFFKIQKLEAPLKYIIGWDLYPESSGILAELDIQEKLNSKRYLEEINITKEIGDAVLMPPEGYDNLGWLTVSGDNTLDAKDNLTDALSFIKYRVVEFDEDSVLGKTSRKNHLSAAMLKKEKLMQAAKRGRIHRMSLEDQRKLCIGIATNISKYNGLDHKAAELAAVQIEKKLRKLGYFTVLLDFNNLNQTLRELRQNYIDLVFNFTIGINNDYSLSHQATAILEALHIPFTGAGSLNLSLARDRIRFKKLLSFHNIPTPKWDYAYSMDDQINPTLCYPLIVKPSCVDRTVGVSNDSVVKNKRQLSRELEKVLKKMNSSALIEEFVEGDEYEVSILGTGKYDLKAFPLSRSVFKRMPKGYWHILSDEVKNADSKAFKKIILQTPLKGVSKKLESLITEIALDAYQIMQCNDYGRVRLRVDNDGNPYVLDVNPNPILLSSSQIVKTAKLIGLDYEDLLEEIIRLAIERYGN